MENNSAPVPEEDMVPRPHPQQEISESKEEPQLPPQLPRLLLPRSVTSPLEALGVSVTVENLRYIPGRTYSDTSELQLLFDLSLESDILTAWDGRLSFEALPVSFSNGTLKWAPVLVSGKYLAISENNVTTLYDMNLGGEPAHTLDFSSYQSPHWFNPPLVEAILYYPDWGYYFSFRNATIYHKFYDLNFDEAGEYGYVEGYFPKYGETVLPPVVELAGGGIAASLGSRTFLLLKNGEGRTEAFWTSYLFNGLHLAGQEKQTLSLAYLPNGEYLAIRTQPDGAAQAFRCAGIDSPVPYDFPDLITGILVPHGDEFTLSQPYTLWFSTGSVQVDFDASCASFLVDFEREAISFGVDYNQTILQNGSLKDISSNRRWELWAINQRYGHESQWGNTLLYDRLTDEYFDFGALDMASNFSAGFVGESKLFLRYFSQQYVPFQDGDDEYYNKLKAEMRQDISLFDLETKETQPLNLDISLLQHNYVIWGYAAHPDGRQVLVVSPRYLTDAEMQPVNPRNIEGSHYYFSIFDSHGNYLYTVSSNIYHFGGKFHTEDISVEWSGEEIWLSGAEGINIETYERLENPSSTPGHSRNIANRKKSVDMLLRTWQVYQPLALSANTTEHLYYNQRIYQYGKPEALFHGGNQTAKGEVFDYIVLRLEEELPHYQSPAPFSLLRDPRSNLFLLQGTQGPSLVGAGSPVPGYWQPALGKQGEDSPRVLGMESLSVSLQKRLVVIAMEGRLSFFLYDSGENSFTPCGAELFGALPVNMVLSSGGQLSYQVEDLGMLSVTAWADGSIAITSAGRPWAGIYYWDGKIVVG